MRHRLHYLSDLVAIAFLLTDELRVFAVILQQLVIVVLDAQLGVFKEHAINVA